MRIKNYDVPDILGSIKEMNVFYRVVLHAIEAFRQDLLEAERETHTDTAESWGLARFENIFGLRTDGSYTTAERQRRLRIWTQEIKHYGFYDVARWLYNLVEEEIRNYGFEDTILTVENEQDGTLAITVRIPLESEKNLQDVARRLEKIVPVGAVLDVSPVYKKVQHYGAYTWAQLASFTFNEAKRGVTPVDPPPTRNTRRDLAGATYAELGAYTWKQLRETNLL